MNRRKGEIAVALYDLLHRCGIFLEELNVLNVGWMSNERWMEKDWMHWIRSICLNEQYVEFEIILNFFNKQRSYSYKFDQTMNNITQLIAI